MPAISKIRVMINVNGTCGQQIKFVLMHVKKTCFFATSPLISDPSNNIYVLTILIHRGAHRD